MAHNIYLFYLRNLSVPNIMNIPKYISRFLIYQDIFVIPPSGEYRSGTMLLSFIAAGSRSHKISDHHHKLGV